jgi:hypothetical protein
LPYYSQGGKDTTSGGTRLRVVDDTIDHGKMGNEGNVLHLAATLGTDGAQERNSRLGNPEG